MREACGKDEGKQLDEDAGPYTLAGVPRIENVCKQLIL